METIRGLGIIGVLSVLILGIVSITNGALSTPIFFILIILFFVFGIMFVVGDDSIKEQKKNENMKKINKHLNGSRKPVTSSTPSISNRSKNFLPSHTYSTPSRNHAIKIDRNNKKVSILTNRFTHHREFNHYAQYDYKERLLGFKNVLETRIVEDGTTVNKTSRSSQIGGAALGGLLAGNVGAVIGGLSGKSTSTEEVNSLELYIIVNSFNDPIIKIPFFNVRSSVKKNNKDYLTALNDIQKWNTILGTLIRTADNDDIKETENNSSAANTSISDEISKLVELKNNNHITEEEFKSYKEKLLK